MEHCFVSTFYGILLTEEEGRRQYNYDGEVDTEGLMQISIDNDEIYNNKYGKWNEFVSIGNYSVPGNECNPTQEGTYLQVISTHNHSYGG